MKKVEKNQFFSSDFEWASFLLELILIHSVSPNKHLEKLFNDCDNGNLTPIEKVISVSSRSFGIRFLAVHTVKTAQINSFLSKLTCRYW